MSSPPIENYTHLFTPYFSFSARGSVFPSKASCGGGAVYYTLGSAYQMPPDPMPETESDELPSINHENKPGYSISRDSLMLMLPVSVQDELRVLPGRIQDAEARGLLLRVCEGGRGFSVRELSVLLSWREEWVRGHLRELVRRQMLEAVCSAESGGQGRLYRTVR